MINSYNSLCDDFYVEMNINTELELPSERDTILTFFERVQKQFPHMGNFCRRDTGEFCLEQDRDGEKYRWISLDVDRICSGCANPVDMEDAYELDRLVLELAPYMLGVSHLDVSWLDATFTMDFDYQGNHNEIIAEALLGCSAFAGLVDLPDTTPVGFSPSAAIALSADCRTQARIAVESRTGAYEIRNGKYKSGEPISLYLTVRRYRKPYGKFDAVRSFAEQCIIADGLMAEQIVPNFVHALNNAIAQRR